MKDIEYIIEEMTDIAKSYKTAEYAHVKDHYDAYIRIIVLNQLPLNLQDNYLKVWEGMKR